MSAPTTVPSSATVGDPRPYEPSMEEILASIRRIIADDQSIPGRARSEAEAPEAEDAPATVHVLRAADGDMPLNETAPDVTEDAMIAQGSIAAPQFAGPDGPVFDEVAPPRGGLAENGPAPFVLDEAEEQPADGVLPRMDDPAPERERAALAEPHATLLSTATNNAVSSAFNVLAASRLADNSAELLGMTRDMVRPLLQSWLDDNLPALVERLVRDEIERVARGGR